MEGHTIITAGSQYRVHFFPQLESTNDEAASKKYRAGDVVVVGEQTRGRGQRGNYWHSIPGLNLTFSLVAEPRFLPAPEQFLLSEAVSLAVTDTLSKFGIRALIKWPNDIYVGDKKIAGILIENDIYGSNLARSVIGIGLNVNETGFPDHLPNPLSMAELIGRQIPVGEVLSEFIRCFDARYRTLEEGEVSLLTADYHTLIYRKDVATRFRRPDGQEFTGTIRRVEPTGMLIIEKEPGQEKGFLFKEVEMVL